MCKDCAEDHVLCYTTVSAFYAESGGSFPLGASAYYQGVPGVLLCGADLDAVSDEELLVF